ncbi:hypothetical protein BH24DEI2_BH24DEI2_20220 [soil metagenome]
MTLSLAWQNRLLWLLKEAHAEGLLLDQEGEPVVRLGHFTFHFHAYFRPPKVDRLKPCAFSASPL